MTTPDPVTQDAAITQPRIFLSTAARERIREMLVEEELEDEGGLRISVRPGAGCSGRPNYSMVLELEPNRDDTILSGGGIRIFLDPTSAWALDGLRVDFVDSPGMGSGFAFQDPRRQGGRAC
jgi:iron-sulfur cluster assembly accessory protein